MFFFWSLLSFTCAVRILNLSWRLCIYYSCSSLPQFSPPGQNWRMFWSWFCPSYIGLFYLWESCLCHVLISWWTGPNWSQYLISLFRQLVPSQNSFPNSISTLSLLVLVHSLNGCSKPFPPAKETSYDCSQGEVSLHRHRSKEGKEPRSCGCSSLFFN